MEKINKEELWRSVLGSIELSISKANFSTWFKNTKILSVENDHVVVGVPNGFAKEWLENKYQSYILQALYKEMPNINTMSCAVYSPQECVEESFGTTAQNDDVSPNNHDSEMTQQQTDVISKKKMYTEPKYTTRPQKVTQTQVNLNSRYTFDNFVVGDHNELAKAACHAVCEDLGKIYNPLFVYGKVGLGKTHLLQSIGNQVRSDDAQKRIIYTTSEKFTAELVNAIKNNKADRFKEEYQKVDLLIIDDVQFLAGKEKTQLEFFHIFNALYNLNKQIVISSDRPPKAISTLEDRLRSRFEGGMIVDVSQPDLETRISILQTKAMERGFYLSDDVLRFMSENIKNNIRELEGALNRVIAICDLHKKEPTQQLVEQALGKIIESSKKKCVQHKNVIDVISEFYEVNTEELISKGRKKEIVYPRQIAMYLLRKELNMSYPGIGKYFSGRDHTTALHAYEKISREIESNERLKEEIDFLKEKLYTA
ncbi:MAG: chromosomal replication initiator protein DnaA [Candidatus Moraniibacteriota bacterium]|nr:MAG: chromosomal replication initiator protein DnaA [Candidatus Moranbacteria bacterium]